MSSPVDLIIPVRFDYGNAVSGLKSLTTQATQQAQQAANAQVKATQDAEKKRMQAAKEAADYIAQVNRDLAKKKADADRSSLKSAEETAEGEKRAAEEAAEAEAAAAKEAADAKKKAAADAYNSWKAKADVQHRQAMQSWEEQQAATKKAEQSTKQFGEQINAVTKAMVSMAVVKGVVSAISERMNEVSEYVRNAAKDFISLRRSMQEVATLSGKQNNNQFTIDEAEAAKKAHLNPTEHRDFQAEFLNYAGSQVSGDEKLGEGQKLTASQGKEYGARVAEFMKAGGIDPKVGAELAGSILEQSNGGESVDQLMAHFSKAANVSEKGRVPFAKAATDMSQIMSMGVSAEDAAKMYAIVSPAAAGQEGTSVQAALRATQEMKNKGTGEEFGVKAGMGQYESVKAFAQNITERKQQFMAAGDTDQMAEDKVQKLLAEKQVASDSREARGLVRGFGRMGAEKGGFQRFEAIEANTPASFEADRKKLYEDSDAGKQAARDADKALADAKAGERNVRIAEIRQEAETQLTNEKRFERVEPMDYARGAEAKLNGTSVRDQIINERALENTYRETGAPDKMITHLGTDNQQTNEQILKALEYQNRLMEEDAKRKDGGPLPAPMPRPAGR